MGNRLTIASVITDYLDRRKDAEIIVPGGWTSLYKTEYGRYHVQYEDALTLSWKDRKKFQKYLNKHFVFLEPTEQDLDECYEEE